MKESRTIVINTGELMPRKIEDPEFGTLEMDVIWIGHASVPLLGESLTLEISTLGGRAPEEWQREAFRSFKSAMSPETMNRVRELVRRYFARQGHTLQDPFSVLEEPHVFIPPVPDKRFDLVVQWSNNLDEEHGLQVMFKAGNPVGTGEILDDNVEDE